MLHVPLSFEVAIFLEIYIRTLLSLGNFLQGLWRIPLGTKRAISSIFHDFYSRKVNRLV